MAARSSRRELPLALAIGVLLLGLAAGTQPTALALPPAQATDFDALCETVLTRAITLTETYCTATGRNAACYGYTTVNAEFQAEADLGALRFEMSGDIVPVRTLAKIRTEPLDPEGEIWGMAVLKLQANLPETNPGQNVTFILFGDTELSAISRTNAFYLSTGLGELVCKQIPEDSLLVRAPEHLTVSFNINEVEIRLSSTVVLRTMHNMLLVRVLEGHVSVTAGGVTRWLVGGQELTVPLGGANGLVASGPPSEPVEAVHEPALDALEPLLAALDGSSFTGMVTLSGPIEIIDLDTPSLTLLGRQVLLDQVTGWQALQPGQWVTIEGKSAGFAIQALEWSLDESRVVLRPTLTPVPTPVPTTPPAFVPPPVSEPIQEPAPEPLKRLTLTGLCSPSPEKVLIWQVWNPNPVAVDFTWEVLEVPERQSGSGTVEAESEYIFETFPAQGSNVVRIFVKDELHDVQPPNWEPCEPEVD